MAERVGSRPVPAEPNRKSVIATTIQVLHPVSSSNRGIPFGYSRPLNPTVCILAGGRGSRLGRLTASTPKPILPVAGRPFLEHVLAQLARNDIHRVVISTGFQAEAVANALGDGERFGLEITYVPDGEIPAGTAGGIRRCLPHLGSRFLVLYGDTYLDVDFCAVFRAFEVQPLRGLMTVLHDEDMHERSNCVVRDGRVLSYNKASPSPEAEFVDYGLLAFDSSVFSLWPYSDLSDVQQAMAEARDMAALEVANRYFEIGTPQSLAETEAFFRSQT